jgi:hypothetical protein
VDRFITLAAGLSAYHRSTICRWKLVVTQRPIAEPVVVWAKWLIQMLINVSEWIPATPFGLLLVVLIAAIVKYVGQPNNDRIVRVGGMTAICVAAFCLCEVLLVAIWLRFHPEARCRK